MPAEVAAVSRLLLRAVRTVCTPAEASCRHISKPIPLLPVAEGDAEVLYIGTICQRTVVSRYVQADWMAQGSFAVRVGADPIEAVLRY